MDKKQLRAIGHHLRPIVTLGQRGLTESVLAEIDRGLRDHELIKIRLPGDDRDARRLQLDEICATCGAEEVQQVGKTALLLRRSARPNPRTSNLIRGLGEAEGNR